MRNFGLNPPSIDARGSLPRAKNRDAAIVTIAALGTVVVALSIYVLAFSFGAGREFSGFLAFLR